MMMHIAHVIGRLNEEYQREQDRQEKKRQDDVKAREAKSCRAYEVCDAHWLVWVCALMVWLLAVCSVIALGTVVVPNRAGQELSIM